MGDQLDSLLSGADISKLDLINNILNQTSLTDDIQKQIDATLNETNKTDTLEFDEATITDLINDMATDNKTLIEMKNETVTTPIKRPEVNMEEIAVIVSFLSLAGLSVLWFEF